MGREVITEVDVKNAKLRRAAAGNLAGDTEPIPLVDKYSDRLLKYIPAEVVGVYVTVDAILRTAGSEIPKHALGWIVFFVLLVMTPIYLWRVQNVQKNHQLAIATISFLVWVFTLGGPFTQLSWYSPFYGALLLPIYTIGVATYKAKK